MEEEPIRKQTPKQCAAATVLVLILPLTAMARQEVLYTVAGTNAGDRLGASVSGAGDVNSDGYWDFMAGSQLSDRNGQNSGLLIVYSGSNGEMLYTYTGSQVGQHLGRSTSAAGDANHDGHDDFIIGSPFEDVTTGGVGGGVRANAGTADLRSGLDGSRIRVFRGGSNDEGKGYSVSGAGDVNADGYCDQIVGSFEGTARVRSGLDGTILHVIEESGNSPHIGWAVSAAGDVDGDGYDDIAGGSAGYDGGKGLVRVFSGLDGSELFRGVGGVVGETLGHSVSYAGDVNNDGRGDVIAGAPGRALGRGMARIYSGASGVVLHTFTENNSDMGWSVGGAVDIDNDGHDDVIAGGPTSVGMSGTEGKAWALSGRTGAILFSISGSSAAQSLGASVAGAGDVDGDGYGEVIVGAPIAHHSAPSGGLAMVLSGDECGAARTIADGCPGAGGFTPALSLTGCVIIGETVSINIDEGPGGAQAVLLLSLGSHPNSLQNGCVIHLAFPPVLIPLGVLSGSGAGQGEKELITTVSGVPNVSYYVVALMRDTTNTVATNTLEIIIAP